MKISQNPEELRMMIDFIIANNVKSFLEIGSRYGTTIETVANAMPAGSLIVSVEMPDGPWGRTDSLDVLRDAMQRIGGRHDAHLLLGDSREDNVLRAVKSLGPFDFVFIDGDHTLKGVTADWENYSPLAKHVGFHDVNTDLDVTPFFKKISHDYNHQLFVSDDLPKMGIGVIDMKVSEAADGDVVIHK